MHGFLEAIVGDGEPARRLRERAVVHAYSMANPDGIALGHMRDVAVDHNPNRTWILGAPLRSEPAPVPEIDVLRRAIVAETGGEAAYFLDFHSHVGWYDRFMFYADGDDPAVRELVEAIARADDGGDGGLVGTECVGGSGSGRRTSTRWARETLGATGHTVEATPHGSPSMKRYRRAGGSFVEGLAATVD